MSGDMKLRIRITEVRTNRYDLTGEVPLIAVLTGQVVGPIDNLLPLMRAQRRRRPIVTVEVEVEPEELEEPEDA